MDILKKVTCRAAKEYLDKVEVDCPEGNSQRLQIHS